MGSAAAPEGYGGLGGASFTLAVDMGTFEPTLKRAEEAARRSSGAIGDALSRGVTKGSGEAARGLLILGQTVDDAQYGFRSIVNNIPQLVMAVGGGAGLAGAVGILAVGINLALTHWEEFKSSVSNTNLGTSVIGGINLATEALEKQGTTWDKLFDKAQTYLKYVGPMGTFGLISDQVIGEGASAEMRALAAGRGRDNAAGAKLFASAEDETVNKGKAKIFGDAVDAAGGMKAVLAASLKEAMKAPGEDEATQKGRLAKVYTAGAGGGEFDPGALGPKFAHAFAGATDAALDKVLEKNAKEAKTGHDAADRKKVQMLNDQGANIEKAMWDEQAKKVHDLEKKKQDLEDLKKGTEEGIHKKKEHFGTFTGWRDLINNMQEERMNRIPKESLERLKEIKAGIDDLNKGIREVRGARFGQ